MQFMIPMITPAQQCCRRWIKSWVFTHLRNPRKDSWVFTHLRNPRKDYREPSRRLITTTSFNSNETSDRKELTSFKTFRLEMTRANINVCVCLLLLFREPLVLSVDFLYELLPPSIILHAEAFFWESYGMTGLCCRFCSQCSLWRHNFHHPLLVMCAN